MTHAAALDRMIAWLSVREDVRAAVLMGSRARTDVPADEWSDTDVLVMITDPAALLDGDEWVTEAFGEAVLSYTEPTPMAGLRERRVLLPDGTEIDVTPVPVEMAALLLADGPALAVLASGYRVLLDKDGLLVDLPARLSALGPVAGPPVTWPPPADEVTNLATDFWHHCVWITKRIRRGELFRAQWTLAVHQRYILLRFAEWQALARSGGTAQVWYDGRFLERWAAPETVAALSGSVAGSSPHGVVTALLASMRAFAALSAEVLAAVGQPYPEDADRWVTAWVTDHTPAPGPSLSR